MGGMEGGAQTIEDRALYHTSRYTRMFRYMNRIRRMNGALHSPDMNAIENIWALWKDRFRKAS